MYSMENNLACIGIDEQSLPRISDCDILTASEDFFHMDRRAAFHVMIYVTDGVMYVTEEGQDHQIAPGELLFLKSGLRHFGKRETLRGTRWFYAHFYLPDPARQGLLLPKKLTSLAGTPLEEKLYQLWEAVHSSDPAEHIRRNLLLYGLLLDIGLEQQPERRSISDEICAYLEGQTDRDFSKALIGSRFFLSYSHLASIFRKETGMSMGQYHNAARMHKAGSLLRSTLLSVGEIADSLGFSDALYFSKKFHTFSGVSPSEYRRQMQQKY